MNQSIAQVKLEQLEEQLRKITDDRAVALVKQLRVLDERGTESTAVFDAYLSEIERAVRADLNALSEAQRSLVRELIVRLTGVLKPSALRKLMRRRLSLEIDDFGRDEAFIARVKPLADFLFNRYWRIEVEGLENIPPAGPCLLVANHSGMLPFDSWMIQYAVQEFHPTGRLVRFLIEEWFTNLPFLGPALMRMGQVRGSQVNAERLLRRGEIVGVFPEGVKGIEKPFRLRYHLQRFGRGGVVRLAMRTGAPILPVAVIGAEETYPLLYNSGFLANALRLPYFPVTPLFPWLGLLGTIPLPSKWSIRFGEPLPLGEFSPGSWDDEILVNTLNEDLRRTIQAMVTGLLQQRRSLFFG